MTVFLDKIITIQPGGKSDPSLFHLCGIDRHLLYSCHLNFSSFRKMLVPIECHSESVRFCFSSFSRLDMILCCLSLQLEKLERSDSGTSPRSPPSIWHSRILHCSGNSPVRTFTFGATVGEEACLCYHCCLNCPPVHESWTETKARFRF